MFRKLKFRTSLYLKKSEDKFLNNIEKMYGKKEDIVIGYGDWSQDKQMKNLLNSLIIRNNLKELAIITGVLFYHLLENHISLAM